MQRVPPEMFSPGNSTELLRTNSGVPGWFGGSTDIASASTVDLTAVNTPAVTITGTTTITSFGVPTRSGDVKYVRFANSLTLTHDASLIALPGLANITTQAEDMMILVSRATFGWRCFSYRKADGRPVGAGCVVDWAYATYTTNAALAGTTPVDDTIPQITEGTEILTVSITPKSATNRLRIRFDGFATAGSSISLVTALHQDAIANALAARLVDLATGAYSTVVLTHEMVAGTTSAITFRIRVGNGTGAAFRFNGSTAGRLLGGAAAATLIVEEITA